jgi:hypothetical protein
VATRIFDRFHSNFEANRAFKIEIKMLTEHDIDHLFKILSQKLVRFKVKI